jgi:hypothetical protein
MLTGGHAATVLAGGATTWRIAAVAFVLAAAAAGQDVEALKRRVAELEQTVVFQREEFQAKLEQLEKRLDEPRDDKTVELTDRIDQIERKVSTQGQLFRRPVSGSSTPAADIWTALQGGLIFTGLFRTRFEVRGNNIDFNGGSNGVDDSGVRFNGRFRLGFGAVFLSDPDGTGEQVTALTEFQSVGSFANDTYLSVPSAANVPVPVSFNLFIEPFEVVSLYQGYLAFQRLLDETINVKVGRQELVFGNEMILGNNSFQEGTVHDSLLVQWHPCPQYWLSAFYGKEAGSDLSIGNSRSDFDEDEMGGLYFEWDAKKTLKVDAYALYFNARSADEDTFITGSTAFMFDNSYRPPIFGHFWTLGARLFATDIKICKDVLSVNAETAWQFGEDSSVATGLVPSRDVGGMCAELLVNYRFNPSREGVKPILTAGYYYAQGGENLADGDLGFQPLFINRHFESTGRDERDNVLRPYHPGGGRYGNMDAVPLFNCHLVKGAVSFALSERLELGAGYVWATTADDMGYGTGTFGHEIDVFGSYIYRENVHFSANVSLFFPGETATNLSDLLFFDVTNPASRRASDDLAWGAYLQALIQF